MDSGASGSKAFMKAIKALRGLCLRDYPEGGWLPGGREMATRLGVSYVTYCKALDRMAKEGFVRGFPKKGHQVVPRHLRCRKIGLILESGVSSPFLAECQSLAAILQALHSRVFNAQIIQASAPEQLHDVALAHGVEGLLWFQPQGKDAALLDEIAALGELPLVAALQGDYPGLDGPPAWGCVTPDLRQIASERAKLMVACGRRRVLYVGDYQGAMNQGLVATFQELGVDLPPELCVKNPTEEPGRVSQLILDHHVMGVVSEGAGDRVERLFLELAELPDAVRPQVQVSWFPQLPALFRRYPNVQQIPRAKECSEDLGELAAKMLLEHLIEGKPLSVVKVRAAFR